MKEKLTAVSIAAGSMMVMSCASGPSAPPPAGTTPNAPTAELAPDATVQSLLSALNAERRTAGLPELMVSSDLGELARYHSTAGASAGAFPLVDPPYPTPVGFSSAMKLRGTLKDRGPRTGAGFVAYWAKDQRMTVLGNWTHVGAAISKSADGRLFAVVLVGHGGGGGALMNPAMAPSGL